MRTRLALIALSALLLAASATACTPRAASTPVAPTATVLKIVDGDTVDVVDDNRGRLRIRLLGIDTPETRKPGYEPACWGQQATEFAAATLLGQRVAVITDPTQDLHDRYGRTLAYLDKADAWDYSVEAARAGAARSYVYDDRPVQRAGEIQAAEEQARQAGAGLWGPPCFGRVEATPVPR